jgi:hypothetical protein
MAGVPTLSCGNECFTTEVRDKNIIKSLRSIFLEKLRGCTRLDIIIANGDFRQLLR